MLRFEGDQDFAQAPPELWAKLTDPRFLAGCIPDVEAVKALEADRAALVLRPNLAFVRGTLEVTLQILDAVTPASARIQVQSKGIGSSSAVEAALALAPQGAGTRVHWAAEVKELGGLLKMVPAGLIQGAAQKLIGDLWAAVERRLGGTA